MLGILDERGDHVHSGVWRWFGAMANQHMDQLTRTNYWYPQALDKYGPNVELRDYQLQCVSDLRDALTRHRSVILQLPTGAGKTAIAGAVAMGLAERGLSLLALVHRHELVSQFCETLERVGLGGRYGIIAAGRAPTPWAQDAGRFGPDPLPPHEPSP